MDPNSALAYYGLGRAYSGKRMYREVIDELGKGVTITNRWPPVVAELAFAYGQTGQRSQALPLLQELKDESKRRYVDASLISTIYVGLGDNKEALDWLERAYDERSSYMPWLKAEPKWDPLRAEPRFHALLEHVGFTP
jgi:serine/threonine-protein kinase